MAELTIEAESFTYLQNRGTTGVSYATIHDAASGNQIGTDSENARELGQIYIPGAGQDLYRVFRFGLKFDCSALPAIFTITAAKIQLYAHSDNSSVDFEVTVVNGDDLDFPGVIADYGELLDEVTSYGAWDTVNWPGAASYIDINLNSTGIALIVDGVVKFGLRSSRDIAKTTPTTLEYGYFSPLSSPPKLVLTYSFAPTVTQQKPSNIQATVATGHGNITSVGDGTVSQHGHCWNRTGTPTTSDSKTELGAASAVGAFTSDMTDLQSGQRYYVRSYVTNEAGTAYSSTTWSFIAGGGGRHIALSG